LLIAFAFIWRDSGRFEPAFWLATAFFIAWIVLWIILDRRMLHAYSCPSCGQRIKDPVIRNRNAGDPIHYYCSYCDIQWDTGLKESSE
jgi:predicted RNA-binding Zn-ribbon protein involved in translation (DUF1610 family)